VIFRAGSGNNILNIQGTLAGALTTVASVPTAGATIGGNDVFIVSSNGGGTGKLNGILGPLAIDAGGGVNSLVFGESANPNPDQVFLTGSNIMSGVGTFATISYAATSGTFGGGVVLREGPANNIVNVQSTGAGAPTTVAGLGGNDLFIVSSNGGGTGVLNGLQAPLAIDGGGGANTLIVGESSYAGNDQVTLTGSTIASTSSDPTFIPVFMPISYVATGGTFFGGVILRTGTGTNALSVLSTAANALTTVATTGTTFSNAITVTSAVKTLNTILGPLAIVGGAATNTLVVDESGNTAADNVGFTANAITSNAGTFAPISYQGNFLPFPAGSLLSPTLSTDGTTTNAGIWLKLGQANDAFTLSSMASLTSSVYVDLGPGNDSATVNVTSTSSYNGLTIDGGAITNPLGSGLNILQVFDVTGGASASISGSKLHPLGTVTVTYGSSISNFSAPNFLVRQVFSGGVQIA
jgi:hypothetical protein